MKDQKYICMIGRGELTAADSRVTELLVRLAQAAAYHGHLVVTGASAGVNQLVAESSLSAGGKIYLLRPHREYEVSWANKMIAKYPGRVRAEIFDPKSGQCRCWLDEVRGGYPEFKTLSQATVAALASYVGMIWDADQVVAYPDYANPDGGATGVAMKVAGKAGTKVRDLTVLAVVEQLEATLKS